MTILALILLFDLKNGWVFEDIDTKVRRTGTHSYLRMEEDKFRAGRDSENRGGIELQDG